MPLSLMKELEREIDSLWDKVGDNNLSISHDVFRAALELRRLIHGQYTLHRGDDGGAVRRLRVPRQSRS